MSTHPHATVPNIAITTEDVPTVNASTMSTNGHVPHPHGLTIPRYFTDGMTHPYDMLEWEKRDALITDTDGKEVFRQDSVEFPVQWSQQATNVVSQKYFRGPLGSPQREHSVKEMIDRVVGAITHWGVLDNYFSVAEADSFYDELTYILVNQMACFSSPIWFNIGVPGTKQVSAACYILDVEDDLDSILNWYVEEGKIFSNGSGAGVNLSKLRGKNEPLSGGGHASGVLSFMSAADKSASVIKSGGRVRRSAKMVILDADHPDIEEFIYCKSKEEAKAKVLVDAGYNASIDGEVYQTVSFQNANNSVGLSREFMEAVEQDLPWETHYRTGGIAKTYQARELFRHIALAAWTSGDPGAFFTDTINSWHTTPNSGSIVSSNPCAEHLRPPNEACTLGSLNLLRFLMKDGQTFDTESFARVTDVMVTALDILVGRADYPTDKIRTQSHTFRTIGLGYNNLGGLLMVKGLAYDSDAGRDYAASITALMTGAAYKQSAFLAHALGAFPGHFENAMPMHSVIARHCDAIPLDIATKPLPDAVIWMAANNTWVEAEDLGHRYGYRNAQVSVEQPGGTVSFMMDCATTGIEPEVALVKYKKLSGGGSLKMANPLVKQALRHLGYSDKTIQDNCIYLASHGSFDGISQMWLKDEHRPIFDCAFPTTPNGRSIAWEGHIKMVAAITPFLCGGTSKTVNMPNSSTVEDVESAYMMAWKSGLKTISIYRDGCKFQQPLTTQQDQSLDPVQVNVGLFPEIPTLQPLSKRLRLPDERPAITHKGSLAGHELYITAGLYEDGSPGELFLKMSKEGSTIAGLMDTIATLTSLALQYGVPLAAMVDKFSHTRFEPSGFTSNKSIPVATSLVDYIFRWLGMKFLTQPAVTETVPDTATSFTPQVVASDAPVCGECGSLCRRSGACWTCETCASSTGCG